MWVTTMMIVTRLTTRSDRPRRHAPRGRTAMAESITASSRQTPSSTTRMQTVSADDGEISSEASCPTPPTAWMTHDEHDADNRQGEQQRGTITSCVPVAETRPQERQEGGDGR